MCLQQSLHDMNSGELNSSLQVQSLLVLIDRTLQCSLKTASSRVWWVGGAWFGVDQQKTGLYRT